MLPFDEICQMTEEECEEYFIGELCRELGLNQDEICWVEDEDEETEGCIIIISGMDFVADDEYINIYLLFNDEPMTACYIPFSVGEEFCVYLNGSMVEDNESSKDIINLVIRNARNAKRVKELEAEVRLLRANKMALPLLADAIVPHMEPE